MGVTGEGKITRKELSPVLTNELDKFENDINSVGTQLGDMAYSIDNGIANSYNLTIPNLTSYKAGQFFRFKAIYANTGASTLNINGLGAKPIKKSVTIDLVNGDILANQTVLVIYDGTAFQLIPSNTVNKNDYVANNGYAVTTGNSVYYIANLNPPPASYVDGMQITLLPHVDCGVTPVLNINNLGALTIVKQDGSPISAGDIKANKPLSLVRVGSNFFIRSSGGGNIKSIQTGISSNVKVSNIIIPISSVILENSLLIISSYPMDSSISVSGSVIRGKFANNSNINILGESNYQTFTWKVVEFKKLKSRQSGSFSSSAVSFDIPISNVDVSKTLVVVTFTTTSTSSDVKNSQITYYLTDSTTLRIAGRNAIDRTVEWQVIEFE